MPGMKPAGEPGGGLEYAEVVRPDPTIVEPPVAPEVVPVPDPAPPAELPTAVPPIELPVPGD